MTASILQSASYAAPKSRRASIGRWTGRIMTTFVVLFLVVDAAMKLVLTKTAIEASAPLGFAPRHLLTIGIIEIACVVLYLIPRTAVLGAVLWTGYFGGAIATHLRLDNPLFTHILAPIYFAAFIWGGLYLRDPRVRAMIAPRA